MLRRIDNPEEPRRYECPDGVVRPSVTTILEVVGKPELVDWAARLERDAIVEVAGDFHEDMPVGKKVGRLGYVASLRARLPRKKAHVVALEEAAAIGTNVHELIEWTMRRELGLPVGPQPELRTRQSLTAFTAYQAWRETVRLKPLHAEKTVWSRAHGYAGTLDLFAEIESAEYSGLVVPDWKTSRGLYRDQELQNAAYVNALVEMGDAHEGTVAGLLLRFPKFQPYHPAEDELAFQAHLLAPAEQPARFAAFLCALGLWRYMRANDPWELKREAERELLSARRQPAAARAAAGSPFEF